MRLRTLTACFFLASIAASCIQDEALNSEAAIDACTGDDVQLANIDADAKEINVYVHKGADLSKQKLVFTLAEGATIQVNNPTQSDTETTYDFTNASQSRQFTVTSEDGQWKPVYTVKVILTELPTVYHFEELVASNKYDKLFEFEQGTPQQGVSKMLQWSSGNPGFDLTGMAKSRTDYPTMQVTNGFSGKAVKLETRDTGSFGAMVKMPIAAGNLFIGSFDVSNALKDALKATNFGFQFYRKPKTLKGYYKYKAGAKYTENGQEVSGAKDKCDIYAILYKTNSNAEMLNGRNALTSDKLVRLARIKPEDIVESDQWTLFSIDFEAEQGRTIDDADLQAGKYKLSIVLSSSVDGGSFKGAVGSTLYVDELELICE